MLRRFGIRKEGSEHGIGPRPNCLSLLRTIDTPSLTSLKLAGWPPTYRRVAQVLIPYHVIGVSLGIRDYRRRLRGRGARR